MSKLVAPVVIEMQDAMVALARELGMTPTNEISYLDMSNIMIDYKDGCIRYVQPDYHNTRYILAWVKEWAPSSVTFELVKPEDYNLPETYGMRKLNPIPIIIPDDLYLVCVSDVDGHHIIGKGCTIEAATKPAMEWLGDCYNEYGENCWVSAYGSVVSIQRNPKRHPIDAAQKKEAKSNGRR